MIINMVFMTAIQAIVFIPTLFFQSITLSTSMAPNTKTMYILYSQNLYSPIYEKSRVSMLPHGSRIEKEATISQYIPASMRLVCESLFCNIMILWDKGSIKVLSSFIFQERMRQYIRSPYIDTDNPVLLPGNM